MVSLKQQTIWYVDLSTLQVVDIGNPCRQAMNGLRCVPGLDLERRTHELTNKGRTFRRQTVLSCGQVFDLLNCQIVLASKKVSDSSEMKSGTGINVLESVICDAPMSITFTAERRKWINKVDCRYAHGGRLPNHPSVVLGTSHRHKNEVHLRQTLE